MRVLVVAPQPFFAERGTPIAVRRLVETLCGDGHRVDLLTYPFGTDIEVDGLEIHRCARFPGIRRVGIGFSWAKVLLDLMLLVKLVGLARPGRYDKVHAVEESIYLALMLRRLHRAEVVYDMDSSLAAQLADTHVFFRLAAPVMRAAEEWAISRSDVVAPMCQDLADYAAGVRASGDPVVLHDVPIERSAGEPRSAAPDSGPSGHRSLALYVGNLEAYQGIDMLVEAAELLSDDLPVKIRVVGGPMEEVRRFRDITADRGLGERIEFVGPRPISQLHDLLEQADILLSPRTKGDNTPLKIYSYMESGRPILATRLRTHTQVLDDSTALLVEPSPEAYALGLTSLVGDTKLRSALGESARLRVRSSYSPWSFTWKVRHIYGSAGVRARSDVADRREGIAGAWNGVERRSARDRRSGRDRRAVPRADLGRRVAERRTLVHA